MMKAISHGLEPKTLRPQTARPSAVVFGTTHEPLVATVDGHDQASQPGAMRAPIPKAAAAPPKSADASFEVLYRLHPGRMLKYDPVTQNGVPTSTYVPGQTFAVVASQHYNVRAAHEPHAFYVEAKTRATDAFRHMPGAKIRFDDVKQTIELGYTFFEMRGIAPAFFAYLAPKAQKDPGRLASSPLASIIDDCRASLMSAPGHSAVSVLHKEAKRFIQAATLHPAPPKALRVTDPTTFLSYLLEGQQGVLVGETHHEAASKRLLIEALPTLRSQGVRTLYLEHLITQQQSMLDAYYAQPAGSAPPLELARYLNHLDRGFLLHGKDNDFSALVKAAQRFGVRVVAFDTETSYASSASSLAGDSRHYAARLSNMNYLACRVMQQAPAGHKWAALVGAAHVHTFHGVPGLAELTGQPALVVRTGRHTPLPSWKQDVSIEENGETLVAQFVLDLPR